MKQRRCFISGHLVLIGSIAVGCLQIASASAHKWTDITPEGGGFHVVQNRGTPLMLVGWNRGERSIHLSTDGGESWTEIATGRTSDQVAVSDSDSNVIYVLSGFSTITVLLTRDGGKSWAEQGQLQCGFAPSSFSVLVHPSQPNRLFIIGCELETEKRRLYRSEDWGVTWQELGYPAPDRYNTGFAFSPLDPSKLYLGVKGVGLHLSTDNGSSWEKIFDGDVVGFTNGESYVFDWANPQVFYGKLNWGLVITLDGGRSWTALASPGTGGTLRDLSISLEDANTLYAATMMGIVRSTDRGVSWKRADTGLPIHPMGAKPSVFWEPEIFSVPNAVCIALPRQVFGAGFYRSTDQGNTWVCETNGIRNVWLNQVNLSSPGVRYVLADLDAALYTSLVTNEDTVDWFRSDASLLSFPSWVDSYWINSYGFQTLSIDPNTPGTLYLMRRAHGFGLLKSVDYGQHWQLKLDGRQYLEAVGILGIPTAVLTPARGRVLVDPRNSSRLMAMGGFLTEGGQVKAHALKSIDGGETWIAIENAALVASAKEFHLDPSNPDRIIAELYEGLYFTDDYGKTWTPITTPAAYSSYERFFLDKRVTGTRMMLKPDSSWDGAGRRLFASSNYGSSWHSLEGPPTSRRWAGDAISMPQIDRESALGVAAPPDLTDSRIFYLSSGLRFTSDWRTWCLLDTDNAVIEYPSPQPAFDFDGRLHLKSMKRLYRLDTDRPLTKLCETDLQPHETSSLRTASSGQLHVGYAVVTPAPTWNFKASRDQNLPAPATFAWYSYTNAEGRLTAQVGVEPSKPATRLASFCTISEAENLAMAIVNTGSEGAAVTVTLRDRDGLVSRDSRGDQLSTLIQIPAHGQIARYVSEILEDIPRPFIGSVSLESDRPVSAVALLNTDSALTVVPAVDVDLTPASTAKSQTLPHFVDGAGCATRLVLLNPSQTQTVAGQVSFYSEEGIPTTLPLDGGSVDSIRYRLPPKGSAVYKTGGGGELKTGYAIIAPDPGSQPPNAKLLFTMLDDKGRVTSEASVGGASETHVLEIPVKLGPGTNTAVAFVNRSDKTSRLDFSFRLREDPYSGDQASDINAERQLGANQKEAKFVNEIFGNLPEKIEGVLQVSSEEPFALVGLRTTFVSQRDAPTQLLIATVPAFEVDDLGLSCLLQPDEKCLLTPAVYPQFVSGGGLSTEVYFINHLGHSLSSAQTTFLETNGSPSAFDLR